MCVCVLGCLLWEQLLSKSEEGTGYPGTGILATGCETPKWVLGPKLGPLQKFVYS